MAWKRVPSNRFNRISLPWGHKVALQEGAPLVHLPPLLHSNHFLSLKVSVSPQRYELTVDMPRDNNSDHVEDVGRLQSQ